MGLMFILNEATIAEQKISRIIKMNGSLAVVGPGFVYAINGWLNHKPNSPEFINSEYGTMLFFLWFYSMILGLLWLSETKRTPTKNSD